MTPPIIPPTMTDVMPLETESGTATRVSCVVAIESFSALMCVVVDGTVVESAQESSPSSVHKNI